VALGRPAPRLSPNGASACQRVYCTGMRVPARVVICVLVVAASLMSGCGSTKKASTTSIASSNVGTSTPPNASTGPTGAAVSNGTGTKASQHTKKAAEPTPAEGKPGRNEADAEAKENRRLQRQREANIRAAGTNILGAAEQDVPLKRRYPKELQGKFLRACKAAKGSTSSCECIIARQEVNLKVEQGQSLAELLALELAFEREHASLEDIRRRRVRAPRLVRHVVRECK